MMTTQSTTSPRRYTIGDVIPGLGVVVDIWTTAYEVRLDSNGRSGIIPFYGPRGVDEQAPVEGLVTFGTGERYGARVVCKNRLPGEDA